jgi:PhoH-like ATPase
MSELKHYVLDTSVLMHDPEAILRFQEHIVVVPIIVIEELDNLKRHPSKAASAQEASRELEKLTKNGNFVEGVRTPGGGLVKIDLDGDVVSNLPTGYDPLKADNIILSTVRKTKSSVKHAVLVSKDLNLRLKATCMGIDAEDYQSDKVPRIESLYTGFREVVVPDEVIPLFYPHGPHQERSDRDGRVYAELLPLDQADIKPNSCWRFKGEQGGRTVLAVYKHTDRTFRLVHKGKNENQKKGVQPRNDEQALALSLCLDPTIDLVTLCGKAGCGKSLMSLLAAWKIVIEGVEPQTDFEERVIDERRTDVDSAPIKPERIVIYTPTRELGPELGFLPGTLEEKIVPWQRPTMSNLRLIAEGSGRDLDALIDEKKIEILPITHIRGDTVNGAMMIVRDAQNLTPHEAKAVVTRVGQGTRLFVEGDLLQVDVHFLDAQSNGLAHVINKFPGQPRYGHIQLIKGERSDLAALAAEIL